MNNWFLMLLGIALTIINQGVPRNFTYFATGPNREVNLRVTAPFVGGIYAPSAVCTVTSGGNAAADMQGTVVARSIVLGANLDFHFDEDLAQ